MGQIIVVQAGRFSKYEDAKEEAVALNNAGAYKAPIHFPVKRGNAWYVAKVTGENEARVVKLHRLRTQTKMKVPRRRC